MADSEMQLEFVAALADVTSTSDMKAVTMKPIAMSVAGYPVLGIVDIKVAWIRAVNLDGTKNCYSTLSMNVSTDRMYVWAGAELHVETRGVNGGLIRDWTIGSIGTVCGMRNSIQNHQTSFNPDIFDVVVPGNTRLVITASEWKYC